MTDHIKKYDFYFCFTSQADADTALQPFFHQPEEGDAYLVTHSKDHAIDIVGVIYDTTPEGEIVPVPGWHVNLRIRGDYIRAEVEAIDSLWGIEPSTPYRVWL